MFQRAHRVQWQKTHHGWKTRSTFENQFFTVLWAFFCRIFWSFKILKFGDLPPSCYCNISQKKNSAIWPYKYHLGLKNEEMIHPYFRNRTLKTLCSLLPVLKSTCSCQSGRSYDSIMVQKSCREVEKQTNKKSHSVLMWLPTSSKQSFSDLLDRRLLGLGSWVFTVDKNFDYPHLCDLLVVA